MGGSAGQVEGRPPRPAGLRVDVSADLQQHGGGLRVAVLDGLMQRRHRALALLSQRVARRARHRPNIRVHHAELEQRKQGFVVARPRELVQQRGVAVVSWP